MEPISELQAADPSERARIMRDWLRADPTEAQVSAVIRFALEEPSTADREYAIHVLRFFVVHMSVVTSFLRGLLDHRRWTTTERGLALEGLLGVVGPVELEQWVVTHPEAEFVETFLLNTDPSDWGDVREMAVVDDRLAPTSRVPIRTLAADIEAGRV